jgi:hypothetical protein
LQRGSIPLLIIAGLTGYDTVGKSSASTLGTRKNMVDGYLGGGEFLSAILATRTISLDRCLTTEIGVEVIPLDMMLQSQNSGILHTSGSPINNLIPRTQNLDLILYEVLEDLSLRDEREYFIGCREKKGFL